MESRKERYAFVWYTPDAWLQLKVTAADAEELDKTYREWRVNAESALKSLRRQGMWLEKVHIDIDAWLAWCAEQGCTPDATARSTYAARLLRQRDFMRGSTTSEVSDKSGDSKRLLSETGPSTKAHETAMAAAELYRQRGLPVAEITQMLQISKSTLYRYLRQQGVVLREQQT